jgi:lipopolysaccharide transport system ATP-binding protein
MIDKKIAIHAHALSKKFCSNSKKSLLYNLLDISKNAFTFNHNTSFLRKDEFWALDKISLNIKKGEVFGIIGQNGAGKSILIKLLCGIFKPNQGIININGTMCSLNEVGVGFHYHLTGKENILVNGTILGISKKDLIQRIDDIVRFAELENVVDIPLQYYSKGMIMRLGFSIVFHCTHASIFLFDEILGVGDLSFQIKCFRALSNIRAQGKTVVIVSHNLQHIKDFCARVLWLNNGKMQMLGDAHKVCDAYEKHILTISNKTLAKKGSIFKYNNNASITQVELLDINNQPCDTYQVADLLKLRIHYLCIESILQPVFIVSIFNAAGYEVISNYSSHDGYYFPSLLGTGYVDFVIKKLSLHPSIYVCSIIFGERKTAEILEWHEKCCFFTVSGNAKSYGIINPFPQWFLYNTTH